jgi:serine protease Do
MSPRPLALAPLLLPLALLALSLRAPQDPPPESAPATPADPVQDPKPDAPEKPWAAILGPPRGRIPMPRPSVVWLEDVGEARMQAAREQRPLFVTLRCLPCKQCAGFDQAVLGATPQLELLLRQFVTVRLTTVQDLDLRQFPVQGWQDLDLSWWGYFLSPEGRIYGVFGGRDHESDTSRISVAALATAMKRVLAHHYDPRRGKWDVDGPVPKLDGERITPFDLPGWKSWGRRYVDVTKLECLHCHQVAEILRQPALDAKKFDKQRDLEVWPLPENVGLTVARDDGLLVTEVAPAGPAAKAGLQAGDVIGAAGGRQLFSQTDLRAALHRAPRGACEIPILWLRGEELQRGTLVLADSWKRTNIQWRASIADGNIGAQPGFAWPNPASDKERSALGIAPDRMAIKPWFGKEKGYIAQAAGLTNSDVITAVNGKQPNLSGRAFLVWFRLTFDPGDQVTLDVKDPKGKGRKISYLVRNRARTGE